MPAVFIEESPNAFRANNTFRNFCTRMITGKMRALKCMSHIQLPICFTSEYFLLTMFFIHIRNKVFQESNALDSKHFALSNKYS